ncbi:MAG TPA: LysR family transcriptional regulator [Bacillota bacterium]|nr:LysR family transcriptional regulator [Bacillota bacterium]
MEDRLYKFKGLIDAGSYTKAAAQLHVSQPALSAAMHKLERELKAELFIRGKRPLTPTPAGTAAYQAAIQLRQQLSELEANLDGLAGKKPVLSLGVIDSIAEVLFVHGNGFSALGTQADLHISVNNSSYLLAACERNELDGALIVKPKQTSSLLQVAVVGREPLVLVTHPSQAPDIARALQDGRLPGFLSYNQNSATAELIHQALARANMSAQAIFHSTSPEILLELTLSGRGCAVLPYLMVRQLIRASTLQVVRHNGLNVIDRPIVAIERRGKRSHPAFAAAVDQTKRLLSELHAETSPTTALH